MKNFSILGKLLIDIQSANPEWTNQAISEWISQNYPNSSVSIRNLQLIKSGDQTNPTTINAIAVVDFVNRFRADDAQKLTVEDVFGINHEPVFNRQSEKGFIEDSFDQLDEILKFIEDYENRH